MICFPLHPFLTIQQYLGVPLNEEDKFIEVSVDPLKPANLMVVQKIDNVTEQIALITKIIDKLKSNEINLKTTEELSNKDQKGPIVLIKRNSKVDYENYKVDLIIAVFVDRFQKTNQNKETLAYHRQNLALALEYHVNHNICKQASQNILLSSKHLSLSVPDLQLPDHFKPLSKSDNAPLSPKSQKSPKRERKISSPVPSSPRNGLDKSTEGVDQAIKVLSIEALNYCMYYWFYVSA